MITEEQTQKLSRRFSIDSYSILREYLQLLFLKYLYELDGSAKIYFKGGTAIHFLYGSFRFSEDLDFTSLHSPSELKKLSKEVAQRLIVEMEGIELKDLDSKGHSFSQMLKYRGPLKFPLTIRLEFSLREKPLTSQVSPIETIFPITPYPLVTHLSSEELLAEKVRALLIRHKGRDLFDLWFLLSKGVSLREDYVEEKMKWYKTTYHRPDLISSIKNFKEKELEMDLRKFLPKNYRSFIKELLNRTLRHLSVTKS
ncbi:MAG: nucleotidyl transferase AbiEii/AbiGii toxin family protein [Deltaproteobacteria bacterium]|nr:nucleotidyl transferase AbiEii/AbiGii toxin family protein [Deltaproteobacteria bacterium]